MLPGFLEDIADKIKPALSDATSTMQAYGERIISNLEQIVDAVQSDELLNVRKFPVTVIGNGVPNGRKFVAEVPTDQDWVLEAIVVDADAATTVRLVDGESGTNPRWGATVAAAGVTAYGGQNIVLAGGTSINLLNSAGNVIVTLQVRFERKPAKTKATRAGAINGSPDRLDSRSEAQEDGRHLGTSRFPGENIRGERHLDRT